MRTKLPLSLVNILGYKKRSTNWTKSHQGAKECARRVRQGAAKKDRLNTEGKYRHELLHSWPWSNKGLTKAQLKRAGL